MEWTEIGNIPNECQTCRHVDCYNCDFADARWVLSKRDELLSLRSLKMRAVARYQRQINEIDRKLRALEYMEQNTPKP